ncbi:hypothetical protein CCHL11_03730 [Colletotrichum chlorophyti]|uniref:Uncharacterized protein n=1 Tax=Colletotrichum chlorophyti TaxID=708187 RepID=A0A1Q8RQP8_9PEZI|nr:hypothetical protein CCHL11_03730 [Colletotrichum chlorophyti]
MTQHSPAVCDSRTIMLAGLKCAPGAQGPLPPAITAAYCSFVGDSSSPLSDVFSLSFIRTYLETSIPIRQVVTTIGKLKIEFGQNSNTATRKAAAAALMIVDRPKLKEYLDILVAPENSDQQLILLYGLLFTHLEFMVGDSWIFFQSVFRKLSDKVQEMLKQNRRKPSLYFDRGLLMNFSLVAGYYALILFSDTFVVDVELYDPSPFENIDASSSSVRVNSAVLHYFCKFIAEFARLNHNKRECRSNKNCRATKWVRQARNVTRDRHLNENVPVEELKEALSNAGLLDCGMGIIESSGAIIDIMENLRREELDNGQDEDGTDFGILREAFYLYSLMGLTRTFWDPVWKLVDEDLPFVTDMPNLETHGVVVLERFERRISEVCVESWYYLVILVGVALEVQKPEYQQRVEALVNEIRNKGITIAEALLEDMKMIWRIRLASQHVGPTC